MENINETYETNMVEETCETVTDVAVPEPCEPVESGWEFDGASAALGGLIALGICGAVKGIKYVYKKGKAYAEYRKAKKTVILEPEDVRIIEEDVADEVSDDDESDE